MAIISPFVFLVCVLIVGSQCSSNGNGSSKWTSNRYKNRPLTTNPDFSYPGLFLADDGRKAKVMWNSSRLLCEDEQWSSCAKYGRPVSITLKMIDKTIPPPRLLNSLTPLPLIIGNLLSTQHSLQQLPRYPLTPYLSSSA